MSEIVTIKPTRIAYEVTFIVHHGAEHTSRIRNIYDTPPHFSAGDHVWFRGLDGFPEDRLTTGKVRGVKHTLGGNALKVDHDITVVIDELSDEDAGILKKD